MHNVPKWLRQYKNLSANASKEYGFEILHENKGNKNLVTTRAFAC